MASLLDSTVNGKLIVQNLLTANNGLEINTVSNIEEAGRRYIILKTISEEENNGNNHSFIRGIQLGDALKYNYIIKKNLTDNTITKSSNITMQPTSLSINPTNTISMVTNRGNISISSPSGITTSGGTFNIYNKCEINNQLAVTGGITARGGNITANIGSISGKTVSASGDITSSSGNISANNGTISGKNISASENITVAGNLPIVNIGGTKIINLSTNITDVNAESTTLPHDIFNSVNSYVIGLIILNIGGRFFGTYSFTSFSGNSTKCIDYHYSGGNGKLDEDSVTFRKDGLKLKVNHPTTNNWISSGSLELKVSILFHEN